MSVMKATFRKHVILSPNLQKEIMIVHLSGSIDVESVDLFRQACRGPLGGRPVLFNLENLSFVGSTGLRPFLESLNDLTKTTGSDVRFCEVRNDFRQILAATPLGRRPCLLNEASGVESYRIEMVPHPSDFENVPIRAASIDFAEDLVETLGSKIGSDGETDFENVLDQDDDLSADG